MATFTRFASTPATGIKDTTAFPYNPSTESALRKQFQDIMDMVTACGNVLEAELEAITAPTKIGAVVSSSAGTFRDFITALEATGIGNVPPPDSITNDKLAATNKTGLLADLGTTDKTDFVLAINETCDTDFVTLSNLVDATAIAVYVPVACGKIDYFALPTVGYGYLLCNGQAVSRTTYSVLFGVIGTTYGAGDGSTTFNVPNISSALTVGILWRN